MKTTDLLKCVDELLIEGTQVLGTRRRGDYSEYVDAAAMRGFRSGTLSFIERVYGTKHPHYTEFFGNTEGEGLHHAEQGVAILKAIRSEISGGWLFNLKGLVTAEIFADFIEMASYLLENGYKDAAAVMTGSVLEEHLRQLCRKNSLDTEEEKDEHIVPKKADRLNADLAKENIYSKLDQKQITAWLDLRNKAAHGKYEEYSNDQVKQLISGIIEFMTRVPV